MPSARIEYEQAQHSPKALAYMRSIGLDPAVILEGSVDASWYTYDRMEPDGTITENIPLPRTFRYYDWKDAIGMEPPESTRLP